MHALLVNKFNPIASVTFRDFPSWPEGDPPPSETHRCRPASDISERQPGSEHHRQTIAARPPENHRCGKPRANQRRFAAIRAQSKGSTGISPVHGLLPSVFGSCWTQLGGKRALPPGCNR